MNKKVRKVFIALLVCLLLAGCGAEKECRHQWSEADCLNGSSCSLCGEVREEAPGHDWKKASCTAPETCRRCGETRGEAAEHEYGKWLLDSDNMYRVCAGCEDRESREIDYAFYLSQEIVGHWVFSYSITEEDFRFAYQLLLDRPADEILFTEDGQIFSCGYEQKDSGMLWEFDHGEYNSRDSVHEIHINAVKANGEKESNSYFSCMGGSLVYIVTDDDGGITAYTKAEGDRIAEVLAGEWNAYYQDRIYSLTFSEDRSFSADFDGEVSGFWQPIEPRYTGEYYETPTVLLNYYKDGKEMTVHSSLIGPFGGEDSPQDQRRNTSISLSIGEHDIYYNPDSREQLTEAVEEADSAPLGTWTSIDYNIYTLATVVIDYSTGAVSFSGGDGPNSPGSSEQGMSTEYSISFNEDGSFSAKLHEEVNGTWKLRRIGVENGVTKWNYYIYTEDANDSSYFEVSSEGRGYLYLHYEKVSLSYNFRQMDEEELAAQKEKNEKAPFMVLGDWFANDASGVEASFRDDGTFTLKLSDDEQYEGWWNFSQLSESEDADWYYYDIETPYDTYVMVLMGDAAEALPDAGTEGTAETDGEEEEEVEKYKEASAVHIVCRGGATSLELRSYLGTYSLKNADGLAAEKEMASKLCGRWSADTATDFEQDEDGVEVSGDFYIDFAEDGSFTACLDEETRGTWAYYGEKDGDPCYMLSFEGAEMDSLFTCYNDGSELVGYCRPYVVVFTR